MVIKEDITNGSSVTDFDIDILPLDFGDAKTVFRGYCIGHKVICPLPCLGARAVEIKIKGAKGDWKIKDIEVY